MTVDKKAFALLALACVAAAGGGAYLAVHHGVSSRQAAPAGGREPAALPQASPVTASPASPGAAASQTPQPVSAAADSQNRSEPVKTAPAAASVKAAQSPASRTPKQAAQPAPAPATIAKARPAEPVEQASPAPSSSPVTPPVETAPAVVPVAQVLAPEPAAPEREFEELVVPAESVVGLQVETSLTSETAQVEDPVRARVTRDVRVGGQVAIPAGSRVEGSVTLVERGGKFKEVARLGVRFHTLFLEDGTRLPMNTESVFREGAAPSGESAAKVGGAAVGGAILGAIFGGTKGAVVGGSAGAAGGAAAVMAGDRNPATLPAGTTVTVRLTAAVTITVEK
jgi:hypothetical protein